MRKIVVAPIHDFYSDFTDPLPSEIRLESSYILKRFDSSILDPAFVFFGRYHSQEDKEELQRCMYAIYHEYDTTTDSSDIPEEIVENIQRIIFSLRIVKRTRAVTTIIHIRSTSHELVPEDVLQIIPKPSIPISYMDHDEEMEHFESADADVIIRYFRIIKRLYEAHGGTYHKILNSLIFFESAHYEQSYKTRLILLVTCLESIFNTSNEQVGYMIRSRCSYFLINNPEERIEFARLIKQIYDLRSTFVHGQGTPDRILRDRELQINLMMKAEDICRKCIHKIFDDDLISIFDNLNLLKQEFNKLELNANSVLVRR